VSTGAITADRQGGYAIACETHDADAGARLGCDGVLGFGEAELAALDPRRRTPLRLDLLGPDRDARAFFDAWAADAERVRRTLFISRRADGREVVAVATLASHGFGVDTSLAVESVRSRADLGRSGVHPKVDLMRLDEEGT
jgi:hypothetical protein